MITVQQTCRFKVTPAWLLFMINSFLDNFLDSSRTSRISLWCYRQPTCTITPYLHLSVLKGHISALFAVIRVGSRERNSFYVTIQPLHPPASGTIEQSNERQQWRYTHGFFRYSPLEQISLLLTINSNTVDLNAQNITPRKTLESPSLFCSEIQQRSIGWSSIYSLPSKLQREGTGKNLYSIGTPRLW
jgi:hypothetical protein